MLQLDLFGSLLVNSPEEKNSEEKQTVIKKAEKDASPASKTQETYYSLIEIAEEKLGTDTLNETKETTKGNELDKKHPKQSGGLVNESEINKPEEVAEQEQEKAAIPKPERNGAVVFEDDKIVVKVKNKHIVTEAVSKEKEKKEPQKRGRKSLQEIESEVDLIEVPDDEVLFQKQYYPISEVAKWFRVNTSLLRFWENEFEILKPKKNRKGDRLFRPEDVKNLQLIYHLLRQRKYTIEGAKDYIKANRKKADTQLQLTNTLQRFKNFLLDLKSNLQS